MIKLSQVLYAEFQKNEHNLRNVLLYIEQYGNVVVRNVNIAPNQKDVMSYAMGKLLEEIKQNDANFLSFRLFDTEVYVKHDHGIIVGCKSLIYNDRFQLKPSNIEIFNMLKQLTLSNCSDDACCGDAMQKILQIAKLVRNKRGKLTLKSAARALMTLDVANPDCLKELFCINEAEFVDIVNDLRRIGVVKPLGNGAWMLPVHTEDELLDCIKNAKLNPQEAYSRATKTAYCDGVGVTYDLSPINSLERADYIADILAKFASEMHWPKTNYMASDILDKSSSPIIADKIIDNLAKRSAVEGWLKDVCDAVVLCPRCGIEVWRALLRYLIINADWLIAWYDEKFICDIIEVVKKYDHKNEMCDKRLLKNMIKKFADAHNE